MFEERNLPQQNFGKLLYLLYVKFLVFYFTIVGFCWSFSCSISQKKFGNGKFREKTQNISALSASAISGKKFLGHAKSLTLGL